MTKLCDIQILKTDNVTDAVSKFLKFRRLGYDEMMNLLEKKVITKAETFDFAFCAEKKAVVVEKCPLTQTKIRYPIQFATPTKIAASQSPAIGLAYAVDIKRMCRVEYLVYAEDEEKFYAERRSVYQTLDMKHYASKEDLITYTTKEGSEGLIHKSSLITTKDTNRQMFSRECFRQLNSRDNSIDYYEYQHNSPEFVRHLGGRPYYFDFTNPNPDKRRLFGVELEYINTQKTTLKLASHELSKYWASVEDGSVRGSGGSEFVSVPLNFEQLDKVIDMIKMCEDNDARVSNSCGIHVHVSAYDYTYKDIVRLAKFCKKNEEDLFAFVTPERRRNRYCRKLDERFNFTDDEEYSLRNFYKGSSASYEEREMQSKWSAGSVRHYWLSLDRLFRFKSDPMKRTVEFRHLQSTLTPDEVLHFINTAYAIVTACKKSNPKTLQDVVEYAQYPDKLQYCINQLK